MSKNSSAKREAKKYADCDDKPSDVIQFERRKRRLEAINESQRVFISNLKHDDMVIGAGAAGTGKTYLSSRIAGELYRTSRDFEYIIMTRPNVEVGPKLGFLPGEMHEKFAPYVAPFEKGLKEELGNKYQNDLYKKILPSPLAYMRGANYDNAIMLLDEAQNTTIEEMKMFLTRVGINSRIFITGDENQSDIRGTNGLAWLIEEVRRQQLPIDVVQFRSDECVRSPLCKMMLQMIERS